MTWWSRDQAIRIGFALLPLCLFFRPPFLPNLVFSPRALIYSNDTLPIFLSPLAPPTTLLEIPSRLIQSVLLYRHVPPLFPLCAFSILLNLVRALVGFILTRSVGWAYPELFSHWALYESTAGFGHLIVAYTIVREGGAENWVPFLAATLPWLEQKPWTYGIAICLAFVGRLVVKLRSRYFTSPAYDPPSAIEEAKLLPGPHTDPPAQHRTTGAVFPIILALLNVVPFALIGEPRDPFPPTSLDILMLSFPRPVDLDTSVEMINTTISSFIPYLNANVSFSAFTHSANHEALVRVLEDYPDLDLRIDDDTHPDDVKGHYLHLAEAFRWQSERPAEWVMLIEDDFPLCAGQWPIVETVLHKLETERQRGETNAGFIGTGGSGLIIHKSYLPMLSMLLRVHSSRHSSLPPSVRHRAPDQIIQDCLIGRPGSLCERTSGRATISSRLILDHIGGMATTTVGKALNSDKWRCGWRHAFHGDEQVDVVVV